MRPTVPPQDEEGFVAPHKLAARAYHESLADEGGAETSARKRNDLRARTAIMRMTGFLEPTTAALGADVARAADGTVARRLSVRAGGAASLGPSLVA